MTHGIQPAPRHDFSMDLGDVELSERVAQAMGRAEELLMQRLSVGEDFIVDKVTHLAHAGGKRFRPLIALLCSEFGAEPGSVNAVKGAVIVEMVHLATLYHDDVMDEAAMRRGVESANVRWGNTVAILAGDILFSRASELMSEIDTATVRHFADTFGQLVTGQMRESVGARGSDPIEHYLAVIREKTAVLIASAAHLGSLHAGAEPEVVQRCSKLGEAIGMVFQIVDDIIDIFSDAGQSGKTPGTDLREGVFTLPVLFALQDESPAGEQLRGMLTGPLERDEDVDDAIELISRTNGRVKALEVVRTYLDVVDEQLRALPDTAANRALRTLAWNTVERVG